MVKYSAADTLELQACMVPVASLYARLSIRSRLEMLDAYNSPATFGASSTPLYLTFLKITAFINFLGFYSDIDLALQLTGHSVLRFPFPYAVPLSFDARS